MTRAAVALLLVSLLGCFPHNPRARTYAKLGEGAAILAGIGISAFANTTADCDEMAKPGIDDAACRSGAKWLSTAGVVLIVGGLLGFVATVSTAEEAPEPPPVEVKAMKSAPAATPARTTAPTAPAPEAQGSAAPQSPPAPMPQ